ncbi:cyclic pyranopterin monophosphate synthase MoaC [bacterium]|nr:cyclic pyranopterin monophosphate synthase MoaC [bacterium]
MQDLTHFDEQGRSKMVDISDKPVTAREALARGSVEMKPETLQRIMDKGISKGDVFEVARLAGIMAAKRTSQLIPLCHPIPITSIGISFLPVKEKNRVDIEAIVKTVDRTGIEMEAMTAVCVAALTIYDMCKAIDRGMSIHKVELIRKSGGKSGVFIKKENG